MARKQAIRGVNLGGWLVLERWITPSLFKGSDAQDEFSYCDSASPEMVARLKRFRQTFVTEADFAWLAAQGIAAVRIPVGSWLFGGQPPYVGAVDFLDRAFAWAEKHGLRILISLHGAPGSQNGQDHSGQKGDIGWGKGDTITRSLETIDKLARRFRQHPALLGIELLNEPSPTLSRRQLLRYYRQAYRTVRQQCGPETWVVFGDAFQLWRWTWSMHWPFFREAYVDTHQYQVFAESDKKRSLASHLRKVRVTAFKICWIGWHRKLVIGEWSGALPSAAFRDLPVAEKQQAYSRYLQAQAQAYKHADAWFYWTYKTEDRGIWSFRDQVEKGQMF